MRAGLILLLATIAVLLAARSLLASPPQGETPAVATHAPPDPAASELAAHDGWMNFREFWFSGGR